MSAKQKNVVSATETLAPANTTLEDAMKLVAEANAKIAKLEAKQSESMPKVVGFAGLHDVDLSRLMGGIQTMASEAKEIIQSAKDLDLGKVAVGGVEVATLIQGSTAAAMKKAGLLGEGKQAAQKVARFRKVEAFLQLGIELGAIKLNVK